MIRRAEMGDAPAIVAMARRFAAAAGTGLPFGAAYADARARQVIGDPNGVALLWDAGRGPQGVLAGLVRHHALFPVIVASELIWWIEPDARGHAARPMLRAFEAWAESRGAERIELACFDERTAAFYARAGYEAQAERHFARALG